MATTIIKSGDSDNQAKVDAAGSLQVTGSVQTVQLFTKAFDAITATYPSATQEVYQSRVGGVSGTVQETLTVNYTDSSKDLILNVART